MNRLRDIGDARIEIAKALAHPEVPPRHDPRALIAAVAIALVSTGVAFWSLLRAPEPAARTVVRSTLTLPEGESLAPGSPGSSLAISRDGQLVAYVAGNQDSRRIYLRRIESLEAQPIEGSEGGATPFFSPDKEWMGFCKDGALFRTRVSGGAPLRVGNCGGLPTGVDWSGDELVLSLAGLHRVPAAGGEPQVLTVLDQDRREKSHRFPQVLPGGDAVLFTLATSTTDSWDDASIAVASMKTGEYKVVLEGGTYARYSPTGHLLYVRGGSLHAVSFNPGSLEVTGQPISRCSLKW